MILPLSPQEEEDQSLYYHPCATIWFTILAARLLSGQYTGVSNRKEANMSVPWPRLTLGPARHFHMDGY